MQLARGVLARVAAQLEASEARLAALEFERWQGAAQLAVTAAIRLAVTSWQRAENATAVDHLARGLGLLTVPRWAVGAVDHLCLVVCWDLEAWR